MKYLLLSLLPLSLFANEPIEFTFKNHQYIRFSEHCTIHSPECGCEDVYFIAEGPYGQYIYKMHYHSDISSDYNMFDY